MIENKIVGFICKKTNFRDNDAIFNVITANGKKSFKARGVNKINSKNAASCNFFMLTEFVTSSKMEMSNQTLKSANSLKIYKKPYENILTASSYLFICSLLDNLSEYINGYDMALKCFEMFENNYYEIDVLNYFLKTICYCLGYKPNIDGCIMCTKKKNLVSFDFELGGFICKDCLDESRYERMTTVFLKEMYDFLITSDFKELDKQRSQKIFKMYCKFLTDNAGLNINNQLILSCI